MARKFIEQSFEEDAHLARRFQKLIALYYSIHLPTDLTFSEKKKEDASIPSSTSERFIWARTTSDKLLLNPNMIILDALLAEDLTITEMLSIPPEKQQLAHDLMTTFNTQHLKQPYNYMRFGDFIKFPERTHDTLAQYLQDEKLKDKLIKFIACVIWKNATMTDKEKSQYSLLKLHNDNLNTYKFNDNFYVESLGIEPAPLDINNVLIKHQNNFDLLFYHCVRDPSYANRILVSQPEQYSDMYVFQILIGFYHQVYLSSKHQAHFLVDTRLLDKIENIGSLFDYLPPDNYKRLTSFFNMPPWQDHNGYKFEDLGGLDLIFRDIFTPTQFIFIIQNKLTFIFPEIKKFYVREAFIKKYLTPEMIHNNQYCFDLIKLSNFYLEDYIEAGVIKLDDPRLMHSHYVQSNDDPHASFSPILYLKENIIGNITFYIRDTPSEFIENMNLNISPSSTELTTFLSKYKEDLKNGLFDYFNFYQFIELPSSMQKQYVAMWNKIISGITPHELPIDSLIKIIEISYLHTLKSKDKVAKKICTPLVLKEILESLEQQPSDKHYIHVLRSLYASLIKCYKDHKFPIEQLTSTIQQKLPLLFEEKSADQTTQEQENTKLQATIKAAVFLTQSTKYGDPIQINFYCMLQEINTSKTVTKDELLNKVATFLVDEPEYELSEDDIQIIASMYSAIDTKNQVDSKPIQQPASYDPSEIKFGPKETSHQSEQQLLDFILKDYLSEPSSNGTEDEINRLIQLNAAIDKHIETNNTQAKKNKSTDAIIFPQSLSEKITTLIKSKLTALFDEMPIKDHQKSSQADITLEEEFTIVVKSLTPSTWFSRLKVSQLNQKLKNKISNYKPTDAHAQNDILDLMVTTLIENPQLALTETETDKFYAIYRVAGKFTNFELLELNRDKTKMSLQN